MKTTILIPILIIFFHINLMGQNIATQTSLQEKFQSPPMEAKPRVWWHWMNGNITLDGIQKDLDWMESIGVGGFHNFDANLFTPLVVDNKIQFMTPEWKKAFKFSTDLAIEKNFEMTIAGSPGWSETGGPWVPAADGMKKYVWSETQIQGGKMFTGQLAPPPSTTGNFQNVALGEKTMLGEGSDHIPEYYKDAKVIAFKLLSQEISVKELSPKVTSSGGSFDVELLTDGDLKTSSYIPPLKIGEEMWVQYEFEEPITFRAASVKGAVEIPLQEFRGGATNRTIQISDDGENFEEIARFSSSINPQNTIAFPPHTAKYWRFAIETLPQTPNPLFASQGIPQDLNPVGVEVAEFNLFSTDRIDQFEDKAGFTPWKEDLPSYKASNSMAIAKSEVYDLTDKMDANGILNWMVPEGEWMIIRLGYSLTGRQNHPASPEATGLEVDKLDPEAVRRYINHYLDLYKDATGGLTGDKGLQFIILDSYEAGHMNWTANFADEFKIRRGYSIEPWIPVLTGRVVESSEKSESFLWDFRKTIGEMIAKNHYDIIGEELNKRDMGRYTESHENSRMFLADGMDVKRNAEIPMSAMWTPGSLAGDSDEEVRSEADIRESASVAHIYGKPFVAAESMTSVGNAFSYYPEKLKRTADLEMASGLNRFVIHTSVHQPLDDIQPGLTLGPFGQYFSRHETWSDVARPWIDYLSRSCFLLQQGRFVADALVLYGENTNITYRFREELPQVPGYEYDFVNSTALIEAIEIKDRKLHTPGGGTYSVLILDESAKEMTLPVLKKLQMIAENGVAITGVKPERSPSLSDNPAEFKEIRDKIWAKSNVHFEPAEKVLKSIGVEEDVVIKDNPEKIIYVHRSTPEQEIYWLNSRSEKYNNANISFRISGKKPELWHPVTGETKPVSWQMVNGRTELQLEFEPWDAYFIVFTEATSDIHFNKTTNEYKESIDLTGPWEVSFQENRGAPQNATFSNLMSLSENEDTEIKYFSGTANYSQTFTLSEIPGKIELDLGEVKNIAEVIINGQNAGVLWKTPFKLDISKFVKSGENTIQIKVTNTWVNRIIGDRQPDTKEKITFTTMPFYKAESPLLPAGLLGPVKIYY